MAEFTPGGESFLAFTHSRQSQTLSGPVFVARRLQRSESSSKISEGVEHESVNSDKVPRAEECSVGDQRGSN